MWERSDQRLGIIHLRLRQDLICRTLFNDLASIRHNHPVAKQPDNIQIVAGKNIADRHLQAKVRQKIQAVIGNLSSIRPFHLRQQRHDLCTERHVGQVAKVLRGKVPVSAVEQ